MAERNTTQYGQLPAYPGHAGLVAVAMTVMLALVMASSTLAGLSNLHAKKSMVTRDTLQSYYVAQAGIQEALATRMVPTSNYLNFLNPLPAGVTPFYNASGLVYQDPMTRQRLVGVYRYIIVGGDPSRRNDGTYYPAPAANAAAPYYAVGPNTTQNAANPVPRLVTFQTSPPDSPFWIVSNGLICRRTTADPVPGEGNIGINRFTGSPTLNASQIGVVPQCAPGYEIDQTTLIARVNLEPETSAWDRVNRFIVNRNPVFPGAGPAPATWGLLNNIVTLPSSAFVPGDGWVNRFNFQNAWTHGTLANTPVRATRLTFYEFGSNLIYQSVDLTTCGNPCNIPGRIPVTASMMLAFAGPLDFRSISRGPIGSPHLYEPNLSGCKGLPLGPGTQTCAIRLFENPGAPGTGTVQYTGMIVVPTLPYLTKVLLLAPLGSTGSTPNVNTGVQYELRINQDLMRSFSQAPGPGLQTVAFQTCPVSGGPPPCPP